MFLAKDLDRWIASHPALLPLYFLVLWVVLIFFIARLTGWAALGEVYRATGESAGQRWSFQTAYMRWWSHYGNCLTVTADPRGLSLAVLWLFRIGHPPLFIPWEEISSQPATWRWFRFVELRFRCAPSIPFRITEGLAQKLAPFLKVSPAVPILR